MKIKQGIEHIEKQGPRFVRQNQPEGKGNPTDKGLTRQKDVMWKGHFPDYDL
jgi:hypothetical protein